MVPDDYFKWAMAYAMQTELNTLTSEKHSLMSFVEFFEALTRVAKDYSPYKSNFIKRVLNFFFS